MENDDKIGIMREFFEEANIDSSSFSQKQRAYMEAIEKITEQYIFDREQAKILLSISLDKKYIAGQMGISRSTLYNNKLVGDFADFCINKVKYEEADNELSRLKQKIDLLENQVKKMVVRDIKIIELENKNEQLVKLLSEKEKIIQDILSADRKSNVRLFKP